MNKKKILDILTFFVYIVLVFFISNSHEMWRDEVDSWLLIRDMNFEDFRFYLKNSGHPGLWYIILLPFGKLGFPNHTIVILHLFIAISNAFLLLFFSPFKRIIKIFFVFSYFLFYEYAVISRSYAIGIFFIFLLCIVYRKRFQSPILYSVLIFLLCNTSAYATIMAASFGFIFFIEVIKRKRINFINLFELSIMAIGGFLFLYQIIPESSNSDIVSNRADFGNILKSIHYSFASGVNANSIFLLPSLTIIPLSLILFWKRKFIFIFFIWNLFFLFCFFSFVYMNDYRHGGFIFISFIASYWMFLDLETRNKVGSLTVNFLGIHSLVFFNLLISLLFSLLFTYESSKNDYNDAFSGSLEFANKLKELGLDNEKSYFVVHNPDNAKTLLIYLNQTKNFYFPCEDRIGSFMRWNSKMYKCSREYPEEIMEKWIKEKKSDFLKANNSQKKLYYITSEPLFRLKLKLIYQNQKFIYKNYGERFYLYE